MGTESDIDRFLKPYSGLKPPSSSLDLNLSPQCVYLVGQVVVNWAALMDRVQFQSKMLLADPAVSASLRERKPRHEAKYGIEHYRNLGRAAYAKARPKALTYFEAMMGRLAKVKGDRDALVHGDLYHADYQRRDALSVFYRGRVATYTPAKLAKVTSEMSTLNGSLMNFDSWVHHARHRSSLETLAGLDRPDKGSHTPHEPPPPPEPSQA
jgi:hypothetical protein